MNNSMSDLFAASEGRQGQQSAMEVTPSSAAKNADEDVQPASQTNQSSVSARGRPLGLTLGVTRPLTQALQARNAAQKKPSRLQLLSKELHLSDTLNASLFTTGQSNKTSHTTALENYTIDEARPGQDEFADKYQVSVCDQFFGEGRYGAVKKCKRVDDNQLFAVKEVRSQVQDDFDKSCMENEILVRLNISDHPNIVRQVDFFSEPSKQTTQLVLEALNGMTLQETLEDETQLDAEMDQLLLDKSPPKNQQEEETKVPFAVNQKELSEEESFFQRSSSVIKNRRQSIRTPAVAGLKRLLTAAKKTYLEEKEARPLVKQILSAVEMMHKMCIVHRDLNPRNIFLHFPDIPMPTSPEIQGDNQSKERQNTAAELFALSSPTARLMGCQVKIIDFNHSKMFNLDDSPVRIKRAKAFSREQQLSEREQWQRLSELPSPAVPVPERKRLSAQPQQTEQVAQSSQPSAENQLTETVSQPGQGEFKLMRTRTSNNNVCNSFSSLGQFGTFCHGQRLKMFSPRVGTHIYRAPEMLHRGQMYSESIDMWAVGCCIYFMLTGRAPFSEFAPMNTLNEQIRQGDFIKERERYQKLSVAAKNLIEGLMTNDVDSRLTVQEALSHPWLLQQDHEALLEDDASSCSSNSDSSQGDATDVKEEFKMHIDAQKDSPTM